MSGIGTMHDSCALSYCQQHGLTLEQATPICKHWRSRGFCIYEASTQSSSKLSSALSQALIYLLSMPNLMSL